MWHYYLYAGEALKNSNPQNNIRSWDGFFFFFATMSEVMEKVGKVMTGLTNVSRKNCGIGDSFLWLMIVL